MTHRTHQERVGHTTAGNGFFFGTPTTNNTPNITPLTVPCILHISVSIILVLVVRRDVTACSLDFYSRKDPKQSEVSEGDSIVMGLLLSQVGKNGPSGCFPTTSVVVSHEIRPFPIVTTLLHITNSVPYPVSNNPIYHITRTSRNATINFCHWDTTHYRRSVCHAIPYCSGPVDLLESKPGRVEGDCTHPSPVHATPRIHGTTTTTTFDGTHTHTLSHPRVAIATIHDRYSVYSISPIWILL